MTARIHTGAPWVLPVADSRVVCHTGIQTTVIAPSSWLDGITVFLSQYFQVSRGDSPTMPGVATIPMVAGMFLSSLLVGRTST